MATAHQIRDLELVTSDANGLREIAGDAAVLVDPEDPEDIAGAVAHACWRTLSCAPR